MAKLWSARFSGEVDEGVNDFNSSVRFDGRMFREDIEGSMAHAAMLGQTGIIPPEEAEAIRRGLKEVLRDLSDGTAVLDPACEDVHMNVETLLTARIGDAGKRLHTARSRNDQVALDLRMVLKKELLTIRGMLTELMEVLADTAENHRETVMPGYTHLQRAQPITFAHHLMAYASMFSRDVTRLEDCCRRMDVCPLGCGALAATTYPIDRELTARSLGFSAAADNSLDGVSDRDFCIELTCALSLIMTHLSRFSEEIILWASWEFKFIELSDSYATGSSIMPQKKNPDVAELVRGKTGRVNGDLVALLTMMKGLPLAYNKDMQEDKEAVFDACDTVKACLPVFCGMVRTMEVRADNMRAAAAKGFINATDCADYLTKKGVPFRDAYTVSGRLVRRCVQRGDTLETLPFEEYRALSPVFEEDIYEAIRLERCVAERKVRGGPAPEETQRQIDGIRAFLSERTEKKSAE